jgi:paraquat-inducible protein B
MKKVKASILILILFSAGTWGFLSSDLDLEIRFDRIHGLQTGDSVFFDENQIGKVEKIEYRKDGAYLVEVSIRSNFASAATEHSEFFVTADPRNRERKAIEVFQTRPGGAILTDGARVEGSSSRSLLLEKLASDIERGLEHLKNEFDDLQGDIEKIPESKRYRELKQELLQLADQLKKTGRETGKKIQEDLIPLLTRELEKLKEKLNSFTREKPDKTV